MVNSYILNSLIMKQSDLNDSGLRREDVAIEPAKTNDFTNVTIACDHFPIVVDFNAGGNGGGGRGRWQLVADGVRNSVGFTWQVMIRSTASAIALGDSAHSAPFSRKGAASSRSRSRTVKENPLRCRLPASLPPTLPRPMNPIFILSIPFTRLRQIVPSSSSCSNDPASLSTGPHLWALPTNSVYPFRCTTCLNSS